MVAVNGRPGGGGARRARSPVVLRACIEHVALSAVSRSSITVRRKVAVSNSGDGTMLK